MSDETACQWVSSRGLLKSCDHRNRLPQSSNRHIDADLLDGLSPGNTVHVCSWLTITRFVKEFVPRLTHPIVMVTNDSDMDAPIFEKPVGPGDEIAKEEIRAFLDSSMCIHWFTQNCTLLHPKVTPIPIGLDYHTYARRASPFQQELLLNHLRTTANPLGERAPLCYGSFHFNMGGKYYTQERLDCYAQVPRELVFYEAQPIPREFSWRRQLDYAFVLSPAGMGIDCHRTWEALVLGCIPIVRKMDVPHDGIYTDLPVLVVDRWSDVTRERLDATLVEFSTRKFSTEKLTLAYWVAKIRDSFSARSLHN
jgi:hypothetical protein